jgi:dolichol-phosphate mannosyltransferase
MSESNVTYSPRVHEGGSTRSEHCYRGFRVGIVIPCYQVERSIASVITAIPDYVDIIIAVDDASSDETLATLRSIQEPRLIVLTHTANQGVGGAMVTGFREALRSELDIVVKVDGDGQMQLERLPELIDPIVENICDYAKGNRFLNAHELVRMPAPRRLGNIALTFLTKFASGYWHVFDPQNGYLAISLDYLKMLHFGRLQKQRYFFENEMLIQLNVLGARVLDCPMPAHYGDEKSSLRITRVLLSFPRQLCRGFFYRMLQRHILRDFSIIIPLYFFGGVLFLFGLIFGGWHWWKALQTNIPTPTGTIMLSVLPLILGIQFLLQGLVVDILQTPRVNPPIKKRQPLSSSSRHED